MLDDDMKFSMGDIIDMVSEYFGEKVETVDATTAKALLKQETEDFMSSGIDDFSSEQFSEEETALLNELKQEKVDASEILGFEQAEKTDKIDANTASVNVEDQSTGIKEKDVDVAALTKKIEAETRVKLETEMREKVTAEMEEEKSKKREEVLKKIEDADKKRAEIQKLPDIEAPIGMQDSISPSSPSISAAKQPSSMKVSYNEIMSLVNMFESSQLLFAHLLTKLIKKKPVQTMFLKTLEKAMKKNPDILKKVDMDKSNKTRGDGSLEPARLFSNLNTLGMPEDKKLKSFFVSLQDVFEERLIATELATGIETKDEIMSNILIQTEKVFNKKNFPQKLQNVFMEHIIPNTTIKPGE